VQRVGNHFVRADFGKINYARSMYNAIVTPFEDDGTFKIKLDTEINDLTICYTVDNTDPECTFDSAWTSSTNITGYYGSDYSHDGTSGADSTSRWAKWTPNIPSDGSYNIYMRWPASPNKVDSAPLTIVYNGGTDTTKRVNQQANGNQWNLIGTYNLTAGTGNSVMIVATDAGYTEADAVMFIKQP